MRAPCERRTLSFTSSVSVYDARAPRCGDGISPYSEAVAGRSDDDPENYGSSKRRSEDVVRAVFADRALIVRPGLIVGPYDPTNRFTYWADRFAAGGDVAIPGPPDRYVQFIDAADLASFIVRLLEERRTGVYDANCPPATVTMGAIVAAARETLEAAFEPVWMDERFLESQGIHGWTDLPLWLAPSYEMPGFMNVDVARAHAHGLTMRPLAETLRDTLAWSRACGAGVDAGDRAGITAARERELLAAWAAAQR